MLARFLLVCFVSVMHCVIPAVNRYAFGSISSSCWQVVQIVRTPIMTTQHSCILHGAALPAQRAAVLTDVLMSRTPTVAMNYPRWHGNAPYAACSSCASCKYDRYADNIAKAVIWWW